MASIKINNTSWNVDQVIKHAESDFINKPQHRQLVKGSEAKKTEHLSSVYSICLVQSKLFGHDNGGSNAGPGSEAGPEENSPQVGAEDTATAGASEPGPVINRPNRKRKADKAVLPAENDPDKEGERAGNEMGDVEGHREFSPEDQSRG